MTTPKKKPAQKVAALQQLSPATRAAAPSSGVDVPALVRDLGAMIDIARKQVAVTADAALTALHWQIGFRARTEVLEDRRGLSRHRRDNWKRSTGAVSTRSRYGGWCNSRRNLRREDFRDAP